jgi:hypothetical protein
MSFDLSSITLAANERVSHATLTLYASTAYGNNPGLPMEVYRVLEPWNEGALTWLKRDASNNWNVPGGDFTGWAGGPYSTSTASSAEEQAVDWDVTELVDQWAEQVIPNYGLLLLSYPGNGLTFFQREVPATNDQPRLTLTTTNGVPRLRVAFDPALSQVLLSWRGVGTAVLQERPDLATGSTWKDSSVTVTPQNGISYATVTPAGNRLFRLPSNP